MQKNLIGVNLELKFDSTTIQPEFEPVYNLPYFAFVSIDISF